MTAQFKISVAHLDASGRDFSSDIPAIWIREALQGGEGGDAGEAGELTVHLAKSGHDVVITGELRAKIQVSCARCLAPTVISIDLPIAALAVLHTAKKRDAEEYEFSEEEADLLAYDGETLVLDDWIRDAILLEIPMTPLCSESCTGMNAPTVESSASEKKETIDPRLQPLLQFKPITKESRRGRS